MKQLVVILLFVFVISAFGQKDTIVIADYTKVMVGTDNDGELYPITSLEGSRQAGFFLNLIPNGKIRVCNPEELFVWINGQLYDRFEDCRLYTSEDLFKYAESDTIFFTVSSKATLSGLSCDLVIFEELHVIKDEVSISRETQDSFSEFVIISLVILVLILGVILSGYSARVAYIVERTFTFKISAYEFVNTSFYSPSSMYLIAFYALSLSFTGLYLDELLQTGFFGELDDAIDFLWMWIKLSTLVFSLFVAKWVLISIVTQLFRFRDLKNFQLFDFINFNVVLLIPLIVFLVGDFILNVPSESWVEEGFLILFPIILILFIIWFSFKFVNNSPRKKLIIISYLCATEIIPVIILLGFFYK